MNSGFYLITGTSRGIGEALARRLLAQGHTVVGVARNRPDSLDSARYHHVTFDLTETSRIGDIMHAADEAVSGRDFDFICLVNNASAVEPVGRIERCAALDIEAHIRIGLVAPMLLTSLFVRRFAAAAARKKVAFISSGAAYTPIAGESVYCSAKAGLNMFAQCIGLEQGDDQSGFEVVSIGPGMVDTEMQLAVRSKTRDEFAMAAFFKRAFDDGMLTQPDDVAAKICTILENRYEQGAAVRVTDTQLRGQ